MYLFWEQKIRGSNPFLPKNFIIISIIMMIISIILIFILIIICLFFLPMIIFLVKDNPTATLDLALEQMNEKANGNQ